jgi:protocatechuate 3,4-dioxygenase beta subunit
MDERKRLTRRQSLARLGGLAALLGAGGWKLAAGEDDADAAGGPAAVASGAVSCVLTPEQTEGPYYVDGAKVRRNVTEGRPGRALTLRLRVVDASTCRPIKGASVDIWHCDALGDYSGVNGARSTFMRGVQRTDANGLAIFRTAYPGWYTGRAVHIHVKVHVAGNVVHTGQLYFPAAVTAAVYRRARLPARALQPPARSRHAERRRRDLPERRPPLAARAPAARHGWLRRRDHDGRPPLVAPTVSWL